MIYSKEIIVLGRPGGGGGALPYKRLMERYAAGWGRIFTTGLTIMGLHFQELLEWGRTFSDFWGKRVVNI